MNLKTVFVCGSSVFLLDNSPLIAQKPQQLILQRRLGTDSETPLPGDFAPTMLTDFGTDRLRVREGVGDIVRKAGRYLQALGAVLPISEQEDAFVNGLVNRATAGRKSRPLRQ